MAGVVLVAAPAVRSGTEAKPIRFVLKEPIVAVSTTTAPELTAEQVQKILVQPL